MPLRVRLPVPRRSEQPLWVQRGGLRLRAAAVPLRGHPQQARGAPGGGGTPRSESATGGCPDEDALGGVCIDRTARGGCFDVAAHPVRLGGKSVLGAPELGQLCGCAAGPCSEKGHTAVTMLKISNGEPHLFIFHRTPQITGPILPASTGPQSRE